jgi:hypothetical protein
MNSRVITIALSATVRAWSAHAHRSRRTSARCSLRPDVAISHRDRVYAAEQFSNTVSVTDPADNKFLGVIRLCEPEPQDFNPLYRGQVVAIMPSVIHPNSK